MAFCSSSGFGPNSSLSFHEITACTETMHSAMKATGAGVMHGAPQFMRQCAGVMHRAPQSMRAWCGSAYLHVQMLLLVATL